MTNKITDNKDGLGLVAMFCQVVLDEQIEFVRKHSKELPPRTKQEELDMTWNEAWDAGSEARTI